MEPTILIILISIVVLIVTGIVMYIYYHKNGGGIIARKIATYKSAPAIQAAMLEATSETIWNDHWIIIVSWQQRDAANGMFKNIDPDTGGDKTFGNVRLSASGNEPPTHTGCNTRATGPMTAGIIVALGSVPWAKLYDGRLYSWEQALGESGLKVIEPEI